MATLFSNPFYLLSLIPLFLLIFVVLPRWRWGVVLIFIWLFLEDIIRRFLPGQPPQVMLIKDGLIFITYFAFFAVFIIKNKKIWRPPFFGGLLLFVGWCIAETLNPNLPNLLFAAVGLRSYFFYLPMIFLGYYMFRNKESLIKFCRIFVYASILLVSLAIFQYIYFYEISSPLIQPLEAAHEVHSFEEGNIKLVSSVFGTGERYARFGLLLALLGLGLLFYPKNSLKQRFFIAISIVAAALGIVISGRRMPIYLLIIGVLVWLFLNYRKSLLRILQFKLEKSLMIFLLILGTIGFLVFFSLGDVAEFFITTIPHLIRDRVSAYSNDFLNAAKASGLFGFGTGALSHGLSYIPEGAEWLQKWMKQIGGVETGPGKIWFELGLIGFLIFIFFYAQMFINWLRQIIKLNKTDLYGLGLSIFLFLTLMLFWFAKGHQIFGDPTTLVCLWFFMGILFRLKFFSEKKPKEIQNYEYVQ